MANPLAQPMASEPTGVRTAVGLICWERLQNLVSPVNLYVSRILGVALRGWKI
jgi:hypothetical protein